MFYKITIGCEVSGKMRN